MRKDLKNFLFDKIQDFPGYWEPRKHNQTRTGWLNSFFSPRLGFYLNDPLCIMAIRQKKKKKKRSRWALEEMCFHIKEVCHQLIVREVLNKKDLRAAESRLFQCGRVGLLFSRKAGQNSTREVCYYLKLLWGFFQRENEVVDDL